MIIKDQKRNRGEAQKKYPAKLDRGTRVVDEKRERGLWEEKKESGN